MYLIAATLNYVLLISSFNFNILQRKIMHLRVNILWSVIKITELFSLKEYVSLFLLLKTSR